MKHFFKRLVRRRSIGEFQEMKDRIMAIADDIAKAIASLDAFVSKETANEAEIASLKTQLDGMTQRATTAESALAAAQAQATANNDAANQAAADAAAVQPLLDKINALNPAPAPAPAA